jgi:O-antigen/teichoic acid export membrane protein
MLDNLIKSLKINRYFTNSSWLMLEKVTQLLVGFFISIWIVRYLGPENFGLLSYVQSIMAIVAVFVTLGLNGIVLREIVKTTENKSVILSTSFFMSFFVSLIIVFTIYFMKEFVLDDSQKWVLLFILSFSLIFESTNILNVYFQERVLSKYVVFSNLISLLIGASVKVGLILGEYPLIYFVIAVVFEKFIYSFSMILFYRYHEKKIDLSFDSDKAKYLLANSWPLILSTLSYIVYTRTDQIMIQEYMSSYEVGIYAAAVRLYEIPFMLTTIISSTFVPLLYKKYNEDKEEFFKMTLKILSYTTLVAYIIVTIFLLFSSDIVTILFGEKYIESAKVLMVLSIVILVQFNSFLRSSYLVLINKQKLFFYLGVFFAFSNIILNAILIPEIGLMGAVVATLVVRIMTLFVYMIFKETRKYFYTQIQSFVLLGIIRRIQ